MSFAGRLLHWTSGRRDCEGIGLQRPIAAVVIFGHRFGQLSTGGVMTKEDLAAHSSSFVEPISPLADWAGKSQQEISDRSTKQKLTKNEKTEPPQELKPMIKLEKHVASCMGVSMPLEVPASAGSIGFMSALRPHRELQYLEPTDWSIHDVINMRTSTPKGFALIAFIGSAIATYIPGPNSTQKLDFPAMLYLINSYRRQLRRHLWL